MDKIELCSDLEEFFRRLRFKEFFHNRHNQDYANTAEGEPLHMSREKQTSNWIPQTGRNPTLDRYIESFSHSAKTTILYKVRKQTYNLTLMERRALESLKANHNITIKPADKGGAVVIMNTTDYLREAHRQLSDSKYYTQLQEDPTKKYMRELNRIIKTLPIRTREQILDLITANPKPDTFYMLPKIHKEGNPGRPIISGSGTLTENISGWEEGILKPLVRNTPSYIQDTTNLLNKLNAIGPLPTGTLLATMDVGSLYTNIPHEDGISACRYFLGPQEPLTETVTKCIEFILTHNYFTFGNDTYLQTTGTAMGTLMAPQYANLFCAKLES
ncbi:uncharacterized protein LOC142472734 [Ascaphus truei]|uniref:uncharacterized protein LOC142472734 n=1 Tax=Ascaphus truei TaxID=8439 RepID=UPI003F5ADB83